MEHTSIESDKGPSSSYYEIKLDAEMAQNPQNVELVSRLNRVSKGFTILQTRIPKVAKQLESLDVNHPEDLSVARIKVAIEQRRMEAAWKLLVYSPDEKNEEN